MVILVGNGEYCITRSLMICTTYPQLCEGWNRKEWDGWGMCNV